MDMQPTFTYRAKKSVMTFFCPLCRSERVQRVHARMSAKNHVQLGMLTILSLMILYPVMQWRALGVYFLYWGLFEASIRLLFKKEVPCPHCGFDATWYKRDVKVARRKVQEFWAKREAEKTLKQTATP